MIQILSRLFIKNRNDVQNPAVRHGYGVLCSVVGVVLNLLLFGGKYLAGVLSGSIAITADAFNNLSDAGSSIITLLGFKLAAQKPHSDHPYGHGRYEYIAGLVVSMAILLMGFDLGKTSVGKILHPEMPVFSPVSAGILAASILVKLYMALYSRGIARRIQSVALAATGTDSLSDAIATSAVLISSLLTHFTGLNIDGWAGAAVSLLILRAGISSARETISPLLGKAPDPEFVRRIHEIVGQYEDVVGIHDLMVHDYGANRVLITLHAEVPATGDIMVLHDMVDTIERRLQEELNCSATIHMDPLCTEDAQVNAIRAKVESHIHQVLGDKISIHDFRRVEGPSHTNVIFDAVVPYNYPINDREIKKKICELVQEIGEDYYAVITIDHPVADL